MRRTPADRDEAMDEMDRQGLEHLLDTHGSDRARWPADAAYGADRLIAVDDLARRALAEAVALDRVLAQAPTADAGPTELEALAARIVASAAATAVDRMATHGATSGATRLSSTTTTAASARVLHFPDRVPPSPVLRPSRPIAGWRTAAALAASLVLGIAIGTTGTALSTVEALAEAIGVDTGREMALALAASDALPEALEELP